MTTPMNFIVEKDDAITTITFIVPSAAIVSMPLSFSVRAAVAGSSRRSRVPGADRDGPGSAFAQAPIQLRSRLRHGEATSDADGRA